MALLNGIGRKLQGLARSVKPSAQNTKALSVILLVLVSSASGFLGGWVGGENHGLDSLSNPSNNRQQVVLKESELISDLAKRVSPSVVSINVVGQDNTSFFGYTNDAELASAGTGVIISSDGIVMTNRHVVPAGTTKVSVTLSDGTELGAEVIGRTSDGDPLDVAFLKITDKKGKDLKVAIIGDSGLVQVGDKVVAIGNALGQFQNTVTAGIISGYGRSLEAGDSSGTSAESLQNLFQTDAAINEGNSGGPLININGEVIGINTAVAGGQNIGFAIPVNDIKALIKSVLEKGKLERPYLGVRYVSLTDDYAYEFNLSTKRGAYILPSKGGQPSILSGSPAEKAGLKEKDVITKISGEKIDENHSLTSLVGKHAVGEQIEVTIVRAGKEQTIKLTLESAPQS